MLGLVRRHMGAGRARKIAVVGHRVLHRLGLYFTVFDLVQHDSLPKRPAQQLHLRSA